MSLVNLAPPAQKLQRQDKLGALQCARNLCNLFVHNVGSCCKGRCSEAKKKEVQLGQVGWTREKWQGCTFVQQGPPWKSGATRRLLLR